MNGGKKAPKKRSTRTHCVELPKTDTYGKKSSLSLYFKGPL